VASRHLARSSQHFYRRLKETIMRRLPFLSFLLLLIIPLAGFSQTNRGTITGRVTDNSHAVIQRARVVVAPGGLVTTSNDLGDFVVSGLAAGNYTVTVTSVGFAPLVKTVTVSGGQTSTVDAVLQVAPGSQQVVVSAESGKDELEAINEEITSPNIVQVMPESQIISLPNANVADAIGRLPGVTLQRDEGEGVYVQVRGLDPRLTNITIDGVTIPSPESSVRQVLLATIPADMVQSIELNKTLSANQDADGIGGSVNMVTKMAGEAPTLNFSSTLGMSPIQNDRYMGQVDTTLGKRFGATHRWGVLMSAGYDYNGRGYNDIEPAPDLNPNDYSSTTPYYDQITLRNYRQARLRWGGSLGADYKLNDHSSLAAHVILSDFKDWGDKWTYTVNTLDKPSYKYSVRAPDFAIGSFSLGGNHILGNKWVTWGTAISRSRELNAAGNPGMDFKANKALKSWASNNCNYAGPQNGNQYLPQWSPACMTPNTSNQADNIYNLANYNADQYNGTTGQGVQLNLQPWGAVGMNYHLGTHSAVLEFGGEFRSAHKFQDAYTPSFDYCPTYPGVQSSEPGVPGEYPGDPGANCTTPANGVTAALFQTGFEDPHYYSGHYFWGPTTDRYRVQQFIGSNPSYFPLDINATRSSSDPANFDLIERVSAGYIMNTVNWDRFRLQAGLRLEATHEYGLGNVVNPVAGPNGDGIDNNGNWIGTTAITTTQDYIDPLPSIQARYALTSETAVRAVYARGISRPNQYDLVPYLTPSGGTVVVADIGNPSELPTHANDYDLLLEQQLKPFGLIEVGFFYKALTNPIVGANVTCNAACLAAVPGSAPGNLAFQNVNGNNASVAGLEFSWEQKFSSLPSGLSGLGLMTNYSYNNSHINGLPQRTDSPSLVGAARHAFNIEPSYEYRRYSSHLGISYNGANIMAYQYYSTASGISECGNPNPNPTASAPLNGPINGPCGDNYFYPHLQVDAQLGVRMYRGLQLEVQGLNLNNEVFGFYNGSPQYMTQREYYKPTYEATLRWTSAAGK
jgi:TonB-dependent receptor